MRHPWRLLALGLLVLVGWCRPALAASLVVLLRAPAPETLVQQSEILLAAELRAAGFAVQILERTPAVELREDMERAAASLQPIAVLAISRVASAGAGEIWLLDRVTGKLVIRRVEPRPVDRRGAGARMRRGRAINPGTTGTAGDLALRAVELLRGSLLEIAAEPTAPGEAGSESDSEIASDSAPPADVARFVAASAPGRRRFFLQGYGLGAAATALGTFTALGPAYAPALRLSLGGSPRGEAPLALRLSAIGFGSSAEARASESGQLVGTARVRQDFLMIEALFAFRRDAVLQPYLTAGVGLRHLRVEGAGTSHLFPGRREDRFAPAFAAGAGLALRLGLRAALTFEAQAVALTGRSRVLIADQRAAGVGPVDGLLSLGLATSL